MRKCDDIVLVFEIIANSLCWQKYAADHRRIRGNFLSISQVGYERDIQYLTTDIVPGLVGRDVAILYDI